jgi:hypothetical protein
LFDALAKMGGTTPARNTRIWLIGSALVNLGCLLVFLMMCKRLFDIGKAVAPVGNNYALQRSWAGRAA